MIVLFIGTTELLLICVLALLLFGGKKLPELMRGLGKGMKEFKDGLEGHPNETQESSQKTNADVSNPPSQDNVNTEDESGQ